jgi:hypothetical protein
MGRRERERWWKRERECGGNKKGVKKRRRTKEKSSPCV